MGSNPGEGKIFTSVETDPWAHRLSFSGVKRHGRGFDKPLPSKAEVTERVELCIYCPCKLLWLVLG